MTKINIPTPLRQYAGKQTTIEVAAGTVGDALTNLVGQSPDLRRHLYTDEGKLRAFVNVYLNDEDIRYLDKEQTALKDNDNISIVPSIAGGCELSDGVGFGVAETLIFVTPRLCCCPSCSR